MPGALDTARVPRRALLGAALGAALAACTGRGRPVAAPTTAPPVDPDLVLVAAAEERERSLVAAYASVTAAFPHLAVELGALGDQHLTHLEALGAPPSTPALGTGSPQRPDGSPAAMAARARLAALERQAAQAHGAAAVGASVQLAALLASLCACETAHAAVL